ncbi:sensor histidine kinase [Klebsiella pneumoniae]|uniref:histidine kinase n=1 Tax=Paenibacillus antri TaxID=2582848 RepID=A0A5R9G5D4_9BACL|nr:sensor histidine kinase [Paenibacillus antri]TLS51577.1 sensor histidine kinase [Paenibacillus antri]TMY86704.1 sensor histidine kinase [Klebsiella pneumoniae]
MVAIRSAWFLFGVYDIQQHPERFLTHQPPVLFAAGVVWLAVFWYTVAYVVPLIAYLRKGEPHLVPLCLELICSGGLFLFLSQDWAGGMAFYNFPAFIVGFLSVGRTPFWSAPLTVAVLPLLSGALWGHSFAVIADRMIDLAVVFAIGFSFCKLLLTLRRIRDMMSVIQQQNQTLELNAKQIERLTIAEERNRLSRELHDTVGHAFTAVIAGMDAVRYLIDVSPTEAKNHLAELRRFASKGLEDVRSHIHQMAPAELKQPLCLTLREMSGQFAEHTSVKINFGASGREVPLSEQVRVTLIRLLQEAMTNAVRHGHASEVEVALRFLEGEVVLKVEDNGVGAKKLVKGFGINSMTERLASVNGTLSIESSPLRGTVVEGKIAI